MGVVESISGRGILIHGDLNTKLLA